MARLQEVSVLQKFPTVKLGPCFNESALRSWQAAADALDQIDGLNGGGILVVRVNGAAKLRPSLRRQMPYSPGI